mmetsp:Transcript_1525/g.1031  ORF Transcript_1525/g.1031 Transcript_1525/m.1031 type:complete len:120 (+) Transcript_1525:768-1127(+)
MILGFEDLTDLEGVTVTCVQNCNNGGSLDISDDMNLAIYGLLPSSVAANTTVIFQLSGLSAMNINAYAYLVAVLHESFAGYFPVITFRQTEISGNATCWETRFAMGSKNRDYYCTLVLD